MFAIFIESKTSTYYENVCYLFQKQQLKFVSFSEAELKFCEGE